MPGCHWRLARQCGVKECLLHWQTSCQWHPRGSAGAQTNRTPSTHLYNLTGDLRRFGSGAIRPDRSIRRLAATSLPEIADRGRSASPDCTVARDSARRRVPAADFSPRWRIRRRRTSLSAGLRSRHNDRHAARALHACPAFADIVGVRGAIGGTASSQLPSGVWLVWTYLLARQSV